MPSSRNNPTPAPGVITAIRAQVRHSQRVSLEINGEFALGISLDVLAHEALFVGQHLDDATIARLMTSVAFDQAKQVALRLLELRPRSQRELTDRLRQRSFAPETITAVCALLSERGLIDDAAFANYLVEQRQRLRHRGAGAIRTDLRRHGIDNETIAEVSVSHDLGSADTTNALAFARTVAARHRGLDRATFTRRLGGALQRRGFDSSAIRHALNTVWQELQQPQ
ncbi:MAG: regulatory protein RecX [Roseiflexaceae bacterium]|jgi:regulatory protein|nr:RecX family transcriptional regulator [Chloroflexaceae bacterium]